MSFGQPVPILRFLTLIVASSCFARVAQADEPVPLILDTDLGGFIDDTFALGAVALGSEFELLGVTTVGGDAKRRALIACRFLEGLGRADVPVAWGRTPQPDIKLGGQAQYASHPAVIFGRSKQPVKESAVELLRSTVVRRPGKVVILAIGPLTNVARLLKQHPECGSKIKHILCMGGQLYEKQDRTNMPQAEWNFAQDIGAVKTVLTSGVSLAMVPLESARGQILTSTDVARLRDALTPSKLQHLALYELQNKPQPELYDLAAAWYASRSDWNSWGRHRHVSIDEEGITWTSSQEKANVFIFRKPESTLLWALEKICKPGKFIAPRPPSNPSSLVPLGGFPRRIHVVEDYDTDIERRWWLAGRIDVLGARPGGRRCCRSVLTQDFDGKMGDTKAIYSAVIFNPVPGPPMGPNTRLSFRYRLEGEFKLRVQLYSLSKGYHRYLTLKDLPQYTWSRATVDLTQMRRHDGSGGPLNVDERIDDIQFYTDPRARLWIDDIVLYEAASPQEIRAFPKHVIFTGWFDTGKQGKEWPGEFEIVKHSPPRTWKAARSIAHPDAGESWIRVDLRGRRLLRPQTILRFDYRIDKDLPLRVLLIDRAGKKQHEKVLQDLESQRWTQASAAFDFQKQPGLHYADEIQFRLPTQAQLMIDDLLLYEPGQQVSGQKTGRP